MALDALLAPQLLPELDVLRVAQKRLGEPGLVGHRRVAAGSSANAMSTIRTGTRTVLARFTSSACP